MGRLAISELTTFRWSFEEDVARYQAAGVPAIGVWRQKLADVGDEKGAELLADSGLVVSSLQWAGGFTGSDGHSHEESLTDARQAIVTAAAIKARCLIIHSGARGVHTHNHARRLFRQALDKLLPLAEERGIALALEPMNSDCGGEFTFLNCFDETLELVASYNSAGIGIALDTYHWGHQPLLLDRLPELAPRLALVQLGDARQPPARGEPNRCQLGDGLIPLREIVHRLAAEGYDGFFEVELMGEEIEAADYCEVIERSLRTFQEWTAGQESKVQSPKSKVVRS
jgi:sugar phosphate isomerase/epimerase